MLKSKTHFEQVPMALVEKLLKPVTKNISEARKKAKGKISGVIAVQQFSIESGGKTMNRYFDIFAIEKDDEESVCWLEAVSTLEAATARVNELAKSGHNRFLILDQKTGLKRVVANLGPIANDMVA
jgi:hypothetical protein